MINHMHEMYGLEIDKLEKKLAKLTSEYEEYRVNNNLDLYFEKNLSDETKTRVLKNIRSLMENSEWDSFDLNKSHNLDSCNPETFLENVI